MAFWHSSPLLSDSITGKAKLWSRSSSDTVQSSIDAVYKRHVTLDSRVDEADDLSPTLSSFSAASCYMEPTGLLPFLSMFFPTFSCPIYSFPRLFVLPSPADFILVAYFQFFINPLIAVESSLAGGPSSSTFNAAHKGEKTKQQNPQIIIIKLLLEVRSAKKIKSDQFQKMTRDERKPRMLLRQRTSSSIIEQHRTSYNFPGHLRTS